MTTQNKIDEAIASAESLFNTPESIAFAKRMEFEDYLNDSYGRIEICGHVFFPSDILKECDPIAFRVYQSDFESMQEENNE
jgi:hypothetical protein